MEVIHSPNLDIRDEWLALHSEKPLLPDVRIIDAHHHLWNRHSGRYLAHEFHQDIVSSGHNVVSSVFIQCRTMLRQEGDEAMKPLGEIEFANGIAEMFASGHYGMTRACEGLVGGADLTLGERLCDVIAQMKQLSGGRLKGMRNSVAWHSDPAVVSSPVTPPPEMLANKQFRAGAARLAREDLSLDIWAYHSQLTEIEDLARALPDLRIIIDHYGGPVGVGPYLGKLDEVRIEWYKSMRQLSSLPNIYLKLSGAGMPVFGYSFAQASSPPDSSSLASAWRSWFYDSVDLFGPERCMFASNFPVDKGMFSYGVFWNACKRLVQGASENEIALLFERTAAQVYDLQNGATIAARSQDGSGKTLPARNITS